MRSAQSPCSSTRPRCARARPSARLLRGAMVAWSDRQEWEEAAAVERAHSKLPQRRRSPPASAMALRSWSPIGRRSQRIARDEPSPPPRPGVHQPAGAWVRDDGGSGGGGSDRVGGAAHLRAVLAGGRLAPRRVVRQLGPKVLAGIRTGRPTRWGRGIKGGGGADIHWNEERGAAAGRRTWQSSKVTGPIFCCAESQVVTLGPLVTGGPPEEGVKSAHARALSMYLRKAGYPPAVRTSLLFAPVTSAQTTESDTNVTVGFPGVRFIE